MTDIQVFKKKEIARKKYARLMDKNPEFSIDIFHSAYDWGFYDALYLMMLNNKITEINDKDIKKRGNILSFGPGFKHNHKIPPEEDWENMRKYYFKKGLDIGKYKKPTKKEMARIEKMLENMDWEFGLIKIKDKNNVND